MSIMWRVTTRWMPARCTAGLCASSMFSGGRGASTQASLRWSKRATPHTLRHACAYQLQGRVSSDVIMAQMRHRSTRSLDPYRASALAFADQLLPAFSDSVRELMVKVGLG